jgi:hypothetical protein
MVHAADGGWPAVWPAIERDGEFGKDLVLAVAHSFDRESEKLGSRISDDQLADLFLWLVHHFPYDEDPKHDGIHAVGPRESVAWWRDSILRRLKARGTLEACQAIRRIAQALPQLDWLKYTVLESQAVTRRKTWVPPKPTDVLKLVKNKAGHLVQNGDQLLRVLVESLRGLEALLHDETPAAQFLWEKEGDHTHRPKDEAAFADYVKIHLEQDLRKKAIIVNREVRIHRGERTDIHVDAVVLDEAGAACDTVTAIIESKGCWNQELEDAMQTQLADR